MEITKVKDCVSIKRLRNLSCSYIVLSNFDLRCIPLTTPVQSCQFQARPNDKMGWFQILDVKIIDALPKYLGLVIGFNSKT
jgi:hypothetical protein